MKGLAKIAILALATLAAAILVAPPALAQSPGDTVGITQYELQSICSSGNRMAADTMGGVHAAWMKGSNNNVIRGVFYNYRPPIGQWGGMVIVNQAGFPQLALMPDGRAVIAFHRSSADSISCAIDTAPGQGFFDIYGIFGRLGSAALLWPYVAVDRDGRIQVVATTTGYVGQQMIIGYNRSTNGGPSWASWVPVDTVMTPSVIVTASPVSDKVAIVYMHPLDSLQMYRNNVYYIISDDGLNWDWQNDKVNVTGYDQNDSLFAYPDLDAVFDYDDNLHCLWNTVTLRGGNVSHKTSIIHADQRSESPVEIVHSDEFWGDCDVSSWNVALGKMSLSVSPADLMAVTYVRFTPTDCSAAGYANGDIFVQSSPNGIVWSAPINVTNSPTPNCPAGDCDSDHWPSAAEGIDDYLHIFYVNDKDAGASAHYEGSITNNPMLYYRIPVEQLGIELPSPVPSDFTLHQNYPNPFNAATTINFDLQAASHVKLGIFDITGARVATLLDRKLAPGNYDITWRADERASGIYFYRLETENGALTNRMVLLK